MDPIQPPFRVGRVEEGRVVDPFSEDSTTMSAGGFADGTWVRVGPNGPEALASPGSARAKLWSLAAERELRLYYPDAALREAADWQNAPGLDDPSLEDLTHLPFVSIDEPHSKDLDQAVYVDASRDGWTVWYAIADAAHFAAPGSALFAESLLRGSTFYLPGLVFPMLPRVLSEDLASLNPHVERRALVFRVDLARDGEVLSTRIVRGRVRSRCKTSYQAVQAYYDEGDVPADVEGPVDDVIRSLEALREVGEARMTRAAEHDVVQVQRREISVGVDEDDGLRFIAMADPRFDSERYNEQISLLCNIVGARFLSDGQDGDSGGDQDSGGHRDAGGNHTVQGIYRFHQPPDDYRLDRLRRQIDSAVRHHSRSGQAPPHLDAWRWGRGRESLADYLGRLPKDEETSRLRSALHRQALLAGGRAGFGPVPGVHHGVGAEAYARFTAPMREAVGVFVHKETWEKLGLVQPADPAADERLRDEVMSAADRSRQLQRRLDHDTNRLVLDQLFSDDLTRADAPKRRATVLGIDRRKTHVQLDDPPIDVKVYHRHLAERLGQNVEAGYDGVSLRAGRRHFLALGDAVTLRALGVDHGSDRWQLELLPAGDSAHRADG